MIASTNFLERAPVSNIRRAVPLPVTGTVQKAIATVTANPVTVAVVNHPATQAVVSSPVTQTAGTVFSKYRWYLLGLAVLAGILFLTRR